MIDLRYPNIQGKTEEEQLVQVKSYLHQLVEQLNWAMKTIESAQGGKTSNVVYRQKEPSTAKEAEDTFNSIKALIIKSADIVKAYETTIFSDFNGKYFADSDFGTYLEETSRAVEENSKGVKETYTHVQTIDSKLEGVEKEIRTTNAYIKRGHLGYHQRLKKEAYGIGIGETDDKGVYNKHAWFTADGLCLFDQSGNEVAYITQNRLYITDAVFLGVVQFGQYRMDTTDGLAFTWIG